MLLLILLAIAGGGLWFLLRSKETNQKAAYDFAFEAATRVVLRQDGRFLDLALAPAAQVTYPPSWRERLFLRIRDLGTPEQQVALDGSVRFTSGFFDPQGHFRAQINFPENPAFLDLTVSHPRALWQIDTINFIWTPHAEPTPPPAIPEASIEPTPSPTPEKSPPAKKTKDKQGKSR